MIMCRILGHDPVFRTDGPTMLWKCRRGCGFNGAKTYDSAAAATRYVAAFNRRDKDDLGRRAPLIGLLPLRIWRHYRERRQVEINVPGRDPPAYPSDQDSPLRRAGEDGPARACPWAIPPRCVRQASNPPEHRRLRAAAVHRRMMPSWSGTPPGLGRGRPEESSASPGRSTRRGGAVRPSGTLLREQDRGELACPVVQFVGRTVVAGAAAFVVVGGPGHPVDRFDHLQGVGCGLGHHGPLFRRSKHDESPGLCVGARGRPRRRLEAPMSVASSTGSSVKRRIVRAVDISSQTSLLAPVMPATYWGCFLGDAAPPLRLGALGSKLFADRPASERALGIAAAQDAEIKRNGALRRAPTSQVRTRSGTVGLRRHRRLADDTPNFLCKTSISSAACRA